MEHRSTTVALGAEEAAEAGLASDAERLDALDDLSDHHGPDLQGDLAGPASFLDLGFGLEAEIQGRHAGGGVTDQTDFLYLRGENQLIH